MYRLCTVSLVVLFLSATSAEDWNRFRGPNGAGVSKDTGFPSELSLEKNMRWRTVVRPGKSSPVLTNLHVFLTGAEDGKLYTQCFDRKTGKLLWERAEPQPRTEVVNTLNHPAAITPVTDGENVYSFFKEYGLISYDASGKLRWKAPLGPFTNVMGIGASPILAGDSIVVVIDQIDDSYIAAFDRRNGEIKWKTAREESDGWGTALHVGNEIITASRGMLGAHSVTSGKRIYTKLGMPTAIVASPVLVGDTVYLFGYGSEDPAPFAPRLARLDKNGDGKLTADEYGTDAFLLGIAKYEGNRDLVITQEKWDAKQRKVLGPNAMVAMRLDRNAKSGVMEAHELWRYDKSFTSVIPSLLHYQDVIYFVKNGGILTSMDAKSGTVLKTGRVEGALGGYSASPVAADGKLYLASEDGSIAVLQAGAEWKVLSVTDLGEPCYATPALSQGSVFLRTGDALYRFGR